jgi:YYY domain-containing protein
VIIGAVLSWWLLLQIFGLIGLPVTVFLFSRLPDRGYPLARPVGLLLSGFVLWIGGSLGFWPNGVGGVLVAAALVGGVGLGLLLRQARRSLIVTIKDWWRQNKTVVITTEILFGLALLGWAIFKSHNPNLETAGGEKWMEIAFVNATLGSERFPPHDPWLSGYGISYYYFGYVLMAMATRLSGLAPSVAYNLFAPSLFALTLTGAFSIVFNMVSMRSNAKDVADGSGARWSAGTLYGLLGALFVGVLGNLEGLLEAIHSRGLLPLAFWQWLDIKDINTAAQPGSWIPSRFMWWWRASRVIHDCSFQGLLSGNCNPPGGDWEVIDEFPFFSFLLGDVHPHVLALPFVLVVVSLALSLMRSWGTDLEHQNRPERIENSGATGWRHFVALRRGWLHIVKGVFGSLPRFLLITLLAGALGFLNTWDFPIYLVLLAVVIGVTRSRAGSPRWLVEMGVGAISIGIGGVLMYLPFYLSFSSQAGGLLPNLFNPTKLQQFVVFFGPFLFVSTAFLAALSFSMRRARWLSKLPTTLILALVGPVAMLALVALTVLLVPSARQWVEGLLRNPDLAAILGDATVGSLLSLSLRTRLGNPWTFLFVGTLLGWCGALLWGALERGSEDDVGRPASSDLFALMMIGVGLLLPLAVEFVYLRDNFGIRMNTVFKFYFQAWVLLALAAAYGAYVVSSSLKGAGRWAWRAALSLMVLAGLVYPAFAIPYKAGNFVGPATLDGMAWLSESRPDDYAAIRWLRENASGSAVILEAPGDGFAAYQYTGRVSALTGMPTLLGWGNHEHQWRGSYEIPAQREPDIEMLFNTVDSARALALLEKYDVAYVYVGPLERERFSAVGLEKFEEMLVTAYQGGNVTIYQRLAVQE